MPTSTQITKGLRSVKIPDLSHDVLHMFSRSVGFVLNVFSEGKLTQEGNYRKSTVSERGQCGMLGVYMQNTCPQVLLRGGWGGGGALTH